MRLKRGNFNEARYKYVTTFTKTVATALEMLANSFRHREISCEHGEVRIDYGERKSQGIPDCGVRCE
jgi:hypothetical protein